LIGFITSIGAMKELKKNSMHWEQTSRGFQADAYSCSKRQAFKGCQKYFT